MSTRLFFLFLMTLSSCSLAEDYDFDSLFSEGNTSNEPTNYSIHAEELIEETNKENKRMREVLRKEKLERKLRVERETYVPERLKRQCAFLIDNHAAYTACTGNVYVLKVISPMAAFASEGKCDYLASNSWMYTVCKNGRSGCSATGNVSQAVSNACYSCGGSNQWLSVYATGVSMRCF